MWVFSLSSMETVETIQHKNLGHKLMFIFVYRNCWRLCSRLRRFNLLVGTVDKLAVMFNSSDSELLHTFHSARADVTQVIHFVNKIYGWQNCYNVTNRHTDKQENGQIDRHTDTQTDKTTDTQTYRPTDRATHRKTQLHNSFIIKFF